MWRSAHAEDDDALVEMFLCLNREDPGLAPVQAANMRRTLAELRRDPRRGRAIVLELDGQPRGYALLIAFWNNELGGEACEVSELYVVPEYRGRGHATSLFAAIAEGELWPAPPVAIALGVTPGNDRARRLYERLGFATAGILMVRRLG